MDLRFWDKWALFRGTGNWDNITHRGLGTWMQYLSFPSRERSTLILSWSSVLLNTFYRTARWKCFWARLLVGKWQTVVPVRADAVSTECTVKTHRHKAAAVVQCYRVFSIRWNTMPLPQALRKIDARRKCEEFSASLRAVASKGGTYHGKLWKLRCGWWWLPCASGANDSIAQLLGASVVRIVIFIFITTAAHRAP